MVDIPTIGEVLYEEFMQPLGLSQNALAKALGIPQNRISDIILGKRGISADTDLRLCRFLGLTDGYFAGMQLDFERIATKRSIAASLQKIVPMSKSNTALNQSSTYCCAILALSSLYLAFII
jgi:addiction module HigA family antidote